MMRAAPVGNGLQDLYHGLGSFRLWTLLGWLDIRQRYARSTLGPFWITLSMGVMVGSMGVVYGTLFGQKMAQYLPMVGDGFVIWGLISGILNESCGAYINNANYIRQNNAGLWVYVFQVAWRQALMFAHNAVISLALMLAFGFPSLTVAWLALPGLLLLVANLVWMGQIFAILSARYRDVPQMVAAVVQIFFYVTPLMWRPDMLHHYRWILTYNPFGALVDISRSPLLGAAPSAQSWLVAAGMAVVGWPLAIFIASKKLHLIAYWV
jgi:lipopolysaccharide transport system permease protein